MNRSRSAPAPLSCSMPRKTYPAITTMPPGQKHQPGPAGSGPALEDVEAQYRERLQREAKDQKSIDIPDPIAPTARTTSVTANAVAAPATEPPDQGTLQRFQDHRRRLDVTESQLLEVLTRLDELDRRVGEIVLVLPEIRRPISRKRLDQIERDAPSTELIVLNQPHWDHHGIKFAHGRIMQPSHYSKKLGGWMDRGLQLGINE